MGEDLMKLTTKDLKTLVYVIASALLYTLTIKLFINAGDLLRGGFSGISLLISRVMYRYFVFLIPFSMLYILFNILPTILVFKYVGKRFAIFSVIQYGLVALFSILIPEMPITGDLILIAIFGGILGGFSVLLALLVNASGGGTDFIAIYAANTLKRDTWGYILAGNVIVLGVAGVLFGWDKALYSIIFQFASTQVVSSRHLRFKQTALTLITEHPDDVIQSILASTRHGITKLWGEGGYSKQPKSMLYMVVNAFEIEDVIEAAKAVDPNVFIAVNKIERIIGNFYHKPFE
jgi:uncharacterized membrane-anchored protein YitT (DUF2179 family)